MLIFNVCYKIGKYSQLFLVHLVQLQTTQGNGGENENIDEHDVAS